MLITRRRTITSLTALSLSASVQAPAWPAKRLTIVVPYAAGGATDTLARVMADRLGAKLGQTVIVDNKGGGKGSIAGGYVAHAPADGYTIMIATAATHAGDPNLMKSVPYERLSPSAMRATSVTMASPRNPLRHPTIAATSASGVAPASSEPPTPCAARRSGRTTGRSASGPRTGRRRRWRPNRSGALRPITELETRKSWLKQVTAISSRSSGSFDAWPRPVAWRTRRNSSVLAEVRELTSIGRCVVDRTARRARQARS